MTPAGATIPDLARWSRLAWITEVGWRTNK